MPQRSRRLYSGAAWAVGAAAKRLGLLAIVSGILISPSLATQPFMDNARELLRAGKAAEAYSLLEAHEVQEAGNTEYDLLLGKAALASGKPSKASFVFERILTVRPDLAEARVEMGRAYYELGNIARARLEFELVLQLQNLPPDLRLATRAYLDTLERLTRAGAPVFRGYAQAGYGHV